MQFLSFFFLLCLARTMQRKSHVLIASHTGCPASTGGTDSHLTLMVPTGDLHRLASLFVHCKAAHSFSSLDSLSEYKWSVMMADSHSLESSSLPFFSLAEIFPYLMQKTLLVFRNHKRGGLQLHKNDTPRKQKKQKQ